MAKKKSKVTVTYTELIATTHEKYDAMIREWESKKTGDVEKDSIIDRFLEMPRAKCEILNMMFENETGMRLF